jgi:transaldolase
MPEDTLEAVAGHGLVGGGSVVDHYTDAAATFTALDSIGVDMSDVTDLLEEQGVEKFAASWADLLAAVDAQLTAAR